MPAPILDQILDRTRETVATRKARRTVRELAEERGDRAPIDVQDLLRANPRGADLRFVAECKRRSPSRGVLRADYDPVEVARGYAAAGASMISVLTEPDFFDGSPDHLRAVRKALPVTPLLRKDFVIDRYQLYEALAWGADAVLLIAAAFDRHAMLDFQQAADDLGLAAVIEVHSPWELDRIDVDAARIVGVNHRDLRTFEVDTSISAEVWRLLPERITRVAESGLSTPEAMTDAARQGADAVLVGEAFVTQPSPGDALREVRERVLETLG